MTLLEYLTTMGLDRAAFARKIGATPEAVRLWEVGRRIPNQVFMKRIADATDNRVMPNDFFGMTATAPVAS